MGDWAMEVCDWEEVIVGEAAIADFRARKSLSKDSIDESKEVCAS